MNIRNTLGQISDKLDENEARRMNMTPSQKWMRRARNPIGYLTTIAIVCIIWLVLGGIATKASQVTGFFTSSGTESFVVFAAGIPVLAVITAIARAIVCLTASAVFKLVENGIRFVKRL